MSTQRIGLSLPPQVEGQLRCFLLVKAGKLNWTIPNPPKDVQLRLLWWGESGKGTYLRPQVESDPSYLSNKDDLDVRYPIRCGPKQFSAYLKDLGELHLDVVFGSTNARFAQINIPDILELDAANPMAKSYLVLCTVSPYNEKIVGKIQVSFSFQTISDTYNVSSSIVPTTDQTYHHTDNKYSSKSNKPNKTKKKIKKDKTLLPLKQVKISKKSPDRYIYSKPSPQSVSLQSPRPDPAMDISFVVGPGASTVHKDTLEQKGVYQSSVRSTPLKTNEKKKKEKVDTSLLNDPSQEIDHVINKNENSDSEKGISCQDSPTVSCVDGQDEMNEAVPVVTLYGKHKENILSSLITKGSLLCNEMLKSTIYSTKERLKEKADSAIVPSVGLLETLLNENQTGDEINNSSLLLQRRSNNKNDMEVKAVDLLMGQQESNDITSLLKRFDLSADDIADDIDISEDEDPLHDSSLLSELFYTTKIPQNINESSILFTDEEHETSKSFEFSKPTTRKKLKYKSKRRVTEDVKYVESDNSENISETNGEESIQNDSSVSEDGYKRLLPDHLTVQNLTMLGRVKYAKMFMLSLKLKSSIPIGTVYFAECKFPVSVNEENNICVEVVRLVSRSAADNTALFERFSISPICFDEEMVAFWWNNDLLYKVYIKLPTDNRATLYGEASLKLREVLTSTNFNKHFELNINGIEKKDILGVLKVSISMATTPEKHNKHKQEFVSSPKKTRKKERIQILAVKINTSSKSIESQASLQYVNQIEKNIEKQQNFQINNQKKEPELSDLNPYKEHQLYSLIIIREGKDLVVVNDIKAMNFYVVVRVYWTQEVLKSKICWNSATPLFTFQQITPVLISMKNVERMENNWLVIEVWNKSVEASKDKLVGMSKISLQQYYLSLKDEKLVEALLQSKFPLVCCDGWIPTTNLLLHEQNGALEVIHALGSHDQLMQLLHMKSQLQKTSAISESLINKDMIKDSRYNEHELNHVVEMSLVSIQGLTLTEDEVWGESDCFIRYHFAHQLHKESFKLSPIKSNTTLYVPNPIFNYTTLHSYILNSNIPLQHCLLNCWNNQHGTETAETSYVLFEVWKRSYTHNIREKLVANAKLPLNKMLAMISLNDSTHGAFQSFQLQLTNPLKHVNGIFNVNISYKQHQPTNIMISRTKQVALSVSILKLCGLKTGEKLLSQVNNSLAYNIDAGMNSYVKFYLSFLGEATARKTNVVAKSFSPTFSYHAEFSLSLLMENICGEEQQSLAEHLEDGFLICQVFHEFTASNVDDVIVGSCEIALSHLLNHVTVFQNWFALNSSLQRSNNKSKSIMGGIEVALKFSNQSDREKVVNVARGIGWSPLMNIDVSDENWISNSLINNQVHSKCEIQIAVETIWLPMNVVHQISHNRDHYKEIYLRYKFYNKPAVCCKREKLLEENDEYCCQLSHQQSFHIRPTTSFAWYLREEMFEIQFWLSYSNNNRKSTLKRDDVLIGSSFIDLSSFSTNPNQSNVISGCYNLFQAGADEICECKTRVSIALNDNPFNATLNKSTTHIHQVSMEDSFNDTDTKVVNNSINSKCEHNLSSIYFHVEEALHIPSVLFKEKSIEPDVYVTYEVESISHTPVCYSSVKPKWNFQKEEKIDIDKFKNRDVEFKLWRCLGNEVNIEKDILMGIAKVDTSPLFAGMKQIVGWYNISDFNRQTIGQLKVAIIPNKILSPSRSNRYFKKMEFLEPVNLEFTCFKNPRENVVTTNDRENDVMNSTSKSLLLEQLKGKLADLDNITKQIVIRSSVNNDIEKDSLVEKVDPEINFEIVLQNEPEKPEKQVSKKDPIHGLNQQINQLQQVEMNNDSNYYEKEHAIYEEFTDHTSHATHNHTRSPPSEVSFEESLDETDELLRHLETFKTKYRHLNTLSAEENQLEDDLSDIEIQNIIHDESNCSNSISKSGINFKYPNNPVNVLNNESESFENEIDIILTTDVNVSSTDNSKDTNDTLADKNHCTDSIFEKDEMLIELPVGGSTSRNYDRVNHNEEYDGDNDDKDYDRNNDNKHDRDNEEFQHSKEDLRTQVQADVPSLPNFFMKPQQLADSMKALRMAANFQRSPYHNSSNSSVTTPSLDVEYTHSLTSNKPMVNTKTILQSQIREKLPADASEMARIASIFSSKAN